MKLKILSDENVSAGFAPVPSTMDNNYEKPRRLNKKRKKDDHGHEERYVKSTRSYD